MNQPTVPELLELVAAENDPAERAVLLRAAEATALGAGTMSGSYLVLVANAHVQADDLETGRRVLELAVHHAHNVHDFRGAARLWVQLDEHGRAVDTLERYEKELRNNPGPGYLWRLLAEGFADELEDADGAARCMARATVDAKTVDDHCSVATALWDLAGDREGAVEEIGRAHV